MFKVVLEFVTLSFLCFGFLAVSQILGPWPGIETAFCALEELLTTESPGKSLLCGILSCPLSLEGVLWKDLFPQLSLYHDGVTCELTHFCYGRQFAPHLKHSFSCFRLYCSRKNTTCFGLEVLTVIWVRCKFHLSKAFLSQTHSFMDTMFGTRLSSWTWWLIKSRHLSLTVLEAGSLRSEC